MIVACVGRPSGAAFAVEGGAASIALDVHFEDGGVVDKAVDGGERHGLIGENFAPFAKWLIGGDQHGAPLVAAPINSNSTLVSAWSLLT